MRKEEVVIHPEQTQGKKMEDIPSPEEMDRRVEKANLPSFEEVKEAGFIRERWGISDVDYKVDEDWNPVALAVEVVLDEGGRMWKDFVYEDGRVVRAD